MVAFSQEQEVKEELKASSVCKLSYISRKAAQIGTPWIAKAVY